MEISVRNAGAPDLGRIVALNNQVQRLHAEAQPDDFLFPTNAEDVSDFFATLLDDDSQTLLLAIADGGVIGYLWYQTQHRHPNPFTRSTSRFCIHHVVVDEQHRRLGVAGRLFEQVEKDARSRGLAEFTLDTWAFNKEAHDFFKAQGFQPSRYILRKTLSEHE